MELETGVGEGRGKLIRIEGHDKPDARPGASVT